MEASFQRDQESEIKGATIRPKSMIKPDSRRQSIKRSVSSNPNHYFQFFKQIIRKTDIDYNERILKFNTMPIIVNINAKLVKIHYLFQMLGVSVIYVINFDGQLVGEITKEKFLNLRYSTPTYAVN